MKIFSRKYALDEFLVYSVIREESHFDKEAVSVSDARGLMQLLPSTALETAAQGGPFGNFKTPQLFFPDVNLDLGCYYLSWLLEIFEGNFAVSLAGYNGGPTSAKIWYEENGSLAVDEFIEEIPLRAVEKLREENSQELRRVRSGLRRGKRSVLKAELREIP